MGDCRPGVHAPECSTRHPAYGDKTAHVAQPQGSMARRAAQAVLATERVRRKAQSLHEPHTGLCEHGRPCAKVNRTAAEGVKPRLRFVIGAVACYSVAGVAHPRIDPVVAPPYKAAPSGGMVKGVKVRETYLDTEGRLRLVLGRTRKERARRLVEDF